MTAPGTAKAREGASEQRRDDDSFPLPTSHSLTPSSVLALQAGGGGQDGRRATWLPGLMAAVDCCRDGSLNVRGAIY